MLRWLAAIIIFQILYSYIVRSNFRVFNCRSRTAKVSCKRQMAYQKTKMGQLESRHTHVASGEHRSNAVSCIKCDHKTGQGTFSDGKFTGVVPDVPLAMVEEILLNLPAHQVVRVCRLVCRDWKELVDSAAHWKERCRRERIQPCDTSRPPEDWRQFYFITKKQRNLIKNPSAQYKLKGWKIVYNGGNCWASEENRKPFPDDKVTKCFVTSFGLCLKQQLINLQKEGYSAAFMDQVQPHIKISDWYAPRFDCGCQYEVIVQLLDQNKKPISTYQPEKVFFEQWNDEPWCQMTHVFKDYGPGVRFVSFTHGGVDTQFWAGHYGIRVTNSSVEICPAAER